MTTETLVLASDHAGITLKSELKAYLAAKGVPVLDVGTDSEASVDYPDFGKKAAEAIISGKAAKGIIICGSGIGISIAANRYPVIRAALCHSAELATLARQHNDANILALGARVVSEEVAKACVDAFLTTPFEGGRHATRVAKLSC